MSVNIPAIKDTNNIPFMSSNTLQNEEHFVLFFVLGFLSVVSNFIVKYNLNNETESYSNIICSISLFENIFIFNQLLSWDISGIPLVSFISSRSKDLLKAITFNYYAPTALLIREIDKSLFWASRIAAWFLNICLCFDWIKLLKNPFTQTKKMLFVYNSTALSLLISLFTVALFCGFNTGDDHILYFDRFNTFLFGVFIIFGFASLFLVFIRFYSGSNATHRNQKAFTIQHFSYVIVYAFLLYYSKLKYNYDDTWSSVCILSTGLVMSFIRWSYQCFSRRMNAANISTNLNLELMSCILYGIQEIFTKKEENKHYVHHGSTNDKVLYIQYQKLLVNNGMSVGWDNNSGIPLHNEHGKDHRTAFIVEYESNLFDSFRSKDEVNNSDIIESFQPKLNTHSITEMKEGKGRSGSFFWRSFDNKFIIKTITDRERDMLRRGFIKSLSDYQMKNKDSLIVKIYGVYTITINDVSEINIILMPNLSLHPTAIFKIFDWKGDAPLKDVDFLWISKIDRAWVAFSKEQIDIIEGNLMKDAQFWRGKNIIDYSFLLTILKLPSREDSSYQSFLNLLGIARLSGRTFISRNRKYIYIIGVIDYLQEYTMRKYAEHYYKAMLHGKDIWDCSAVEPRFYSERFVKFLKNCVLVYGEDAEEVV